jgi:hypothetical protein
MTKLDIKNEGNDNGRPVRIGFPIDSSDNHNQKENKSWHI